MTIKSFFIFNNVGKARISRFYEEISYEKKLQVLKDVYAIVSKIDEKSCNFLNYEGAYASPTRIITRSYGSLFFAMLIDEDESELGVLDLIQIIVECLDKIFESACELDLIYNPDKVNALLDEIIIGGLVIETNMTEILEIYKAATDLEKKK